MNFSFENSIKFCVLHSREQISPLLTQGHVKPPKTLHTVQGCYDFKSAWSQRPYIFVLSPLAISLWLMRNVSALPTHPPFISLYHNPLSSPTSHSTPDEPGQLKIYLPKKLLECLPKCSSLPKERHRWNTNEVGTRHAVWNIGDIFVLLVMLFFG